MQIPTLDFPILTTTEDLSATVRISGNIIARGVSYDDFLNDERFDGMHLEWVNGVVILMPGIDLRHDTIVRYLGILFMIFLEKIDGGRVLGDPFLMKLPNVPSSRAPDLQVLLPERLPQLQRKENIGPANLVVEVISPGSKRTDEVDKLREYELGGVPEYWLLDAEKQSARFYQLTDAGIYEQAEPDANGIYHPSQLSPLRLPVALLWRENLPSVIETVAMVEALFSE